jgi:hypothetical protein
VSIADLLMGRFVRSIRATLIDSLACSPQPLENELYNNRIKDAYNITKNERIRNAGLLRRFPRQPRPE